MEVHGTEKSIHFQILKYSMVRWIGSNQNSWYAGVRMQDGLRRPGGVFFKTGFGCALWVITLNHFPAAQICPKSHEIVSSYKKQFQLQILLYRSVQTRMKLLPAAQKHFQHQFVHCPNTHKIISSSMRAFPVAQIRPNLHKFVSSSIRAYHVAHNRPSSHKIVSSCIRVFPV